MRRPNRKPSYTDISNIDNWRSTADYIIYKAGTVIKCLNGNTGTIDYTEATNVDPCINGAISDMDNGGIIFVKPGSYYVNAPIVSGNKSVQILGSGWGTSAIITNNPVTLFRPTASLGANYLFDFGDATGNAWNCVLKDFMIDGEDRSDNLGGIKWVNQLYGKIDSIHVNHMDKADSIGLNLTHDGNYNSIYNIIRSFRVYEVQIGIQLDEMANLNHIYACGLYLGEQTEGYGIYFNQTGSSDVPMDNLIQSTELIHYDDADSIGVYMKYGMLNSMHNVRMEDCYTNLQIDATNDGYNRIIDNYFLTPVANDVIDNGAAESRYLSNVGYTTFRKGTALTVADGGTIAHGLPDTPQTLSLVGTVAQEHITVSGLDGTNITVAIKADGGAAGTAQTIYWSAEYQP